MKYLGGSFCFFGRLRYMVGGNWVTHDGSIYVQNGHNNDCGVGVVRL